MGPNENVFAAWTVFGVRKYEAVAAASITASRRKNVSGKNTAPMITSKKMTLIPPSKRHGADGSSSARSLCGIRS